MTQFNFQSISAAIAKTKDELALELARQAQEYYAAAFKAQGWDGRAWAEVQRREPGTNAYKYPKTSGLDRRTAPILQRSGKLMGAVDQLANGASITRSGSKISITLRLEGVPYGGYLNNGTPKMPRRQFMGDSAGLRRKLMETISEKMTKAFES